MACKHEHLRTVGFDWFCRDCGEKLDPNKLFGKKEPKEPAPAPAEQAENPPAEPRTNKSTAKKTTAKKAGKRGEKE